MESSLNHIENRIYSIRGVQVMLDNDLAELYQTETKYINRAVHRNPGRFPLAFAYQLTQEEWAALRFQIGTLNEKAGRGQHRKYMPYVFTEQGVAMLSAVLNTEIAIQVSIQIMHAFVAMRKTMGQLQGVIQRLEGVEHKQWQTDARLEKVLEALEADTKPRQGVFFEGQLFDAHVFASNLIKAAKTHIELVDNYVDENTLLLLSKRSPGVRCTIHTRIRPALQQDLEKHNLQYAPVRLTENRSSHDRFLIIDNLELYHIGASLKDLGNKCFAFSRMDDLRQDIQSKLLQSFATD
jgi:phage regulator Rha-like protein